MFRPYQSILKGNFLHSTKTTKPQGKLAGLSLIIFDFEQRQITRVGFEPATSGLVCRHFTNCAGKCKKVVNVLLFFFYLL